jgi:hypothetical protein
VFIPDYFYESLETVFLGLKILNFSGADPDPGFGIFLNPRSRMEKFVSGIWDRG